uniref:Cytochrome c oxidase subunit 7B, mitochondrial n=1 Tax=Strix occidentalis caurina TaxID=311401 RepID=A0A8D0EKH1_STROC
LFPLPSSPPSLPFKNLEGMRKRAAVRQAHRKYEPNFHDKYGNLVLLGGATVFTAVWAYVFTKAGIEWGLSPVGRITPKEWRE